jgi:predicted signal transduction protein with EAL and GGDEF domain
MEGLRRQCATQIVVLDGQELGFTVSMGVASFPHTAHTQDELLAACEAALAEARRRGGNHVTLASIRFGLQLISQLPSLAQPCRRQAEQQQRETALELATSVRCATRRPAAPSAHAGGGDQRQRRQVQVAQGAGQRGGRPQPAIT